MYPWMKGFRKTYENFYTLGRYPKEFRRDYFVYMERCKEAELSFEETLAPILQEISFYCIILYDLLDG